MSPSCDMYFTLDYKPDLSIKHSMKRSMEEIVM